MSVPPLCLSHHPHWPPRSDLESSRPRSTQQPEGSDRPKCQLMCVPRLSPSWPRTCHTADHCARSRPSSLSGGLGCQGKGTEPPGSLGPTALTSQVKVTPCNSQVSPEKQDQWDVYIYTDRFILRSWLMCINLESGKSYICRTGQQVGESGRASVSVQVQRPSTGGIPSCSEEVSFFVLFGPSTDWTRPIHITEVNLFLLEIY